MKNILRPTRVKIILDVLLSLGLVSEIIFLPRAGFSGTFSQLTLERKLVSFLLSWIISCIMYYPLFAGLVYLVGALKNSVSEKKEIILALIFIAIFNPLTISLVFSKIVSRGPALPANGSVSNNNSNNNSVQNNLPPEAICGMWIEEIAPNSKVKEAGIEKGDVILKFDNVEIKSIQDIFAQLERKRPGDKVLLETGRGAKTVELARDVKDPNRAVLGLKLEPNPCGK
jgi:membrane-associated protease RseP (regulator of RpoE activity)